MIELQLDQTRHAIDVWRCRWRFDDGAADAWRHRRFVALLQPLPREPAVVGVEIVGRGQPIPIGRGLLIVEAVVGARAPVKPGRTIVGARERGRRALEDTNGVLILIVPVSPPPGAPRRTLREF